MSSHILKALLILGVHFKCHSMADTMLAASEEVKSSERLKRILTIVLVMGNFLNANSYRSVHFVDGQFIMLEYSMFLLQRCCYCIQAGVPS